MVEPFGAAGLALAALTLPAQVFSSCVLAYTTVSDIRTYGKHFSNLFWLFRLQHTRFLVWGQNSAIYEDGISPEKLSQPVYEMVISTLIKIKELLEDIDKLRSYYGLQQEPTPNMAEPQIAEREIRRQATIVFRVQKSCSLFRKLRWVVLDANRFGNLVQALTQYNDTLYEFLPIVQRSSQTIAVDAEALALAIVNEGWQGVQNLQQAFMNHQTGVMPNAPTGANAHLAAQAGAYIQGLGLTAVEGGPTQLPHAFRPAPDLFMGFRGFNVEDLQSQRRSWATELGYGTKVVIEWRPYNELEIVGYHKIALQLGVEALTRMLKGPKPAGFRTLDCIGYVEDETKPRFGVAFRLPHPHRQNFGCTPKTLYELIKSKRTPFLEDRFRLASFLAESLYEFHTTRWLHRNISSHNLLFFAGNETSSSNPRHPIRLPEPWFTGFVFSRPDEPGAASHAIAADLNNAIYRHPDRQGDVASLPRFHCLYDIYSLGTVLLEIGTWSTLISFYKTGYNGAAFRDRLLADKLPLLGITMGESFMVAIRKCLECKFDGMRHFLDNERDTQDYILNLQRSFYWEVVKVLKECHV